MKSNKEEERKRESSLNLDWRLNQTLKNVQGYIHNLGPNAKGGLYLGMKPRQWYGASPTGGSHTGDVFSILEYINPKIVVEEMEPDKLRSRPYRGPDSSGPRCIHLCPSAEIDVDATIVDVGAEIVVDSGTVGVDADVPLQCTPSNKKTCLWISLGVVKAAISDVLGISPTCTTSFDARMLMFGTTLYIYQLLASNFDSSSSSSFIYLSSSYVTSSPSSFS
eukprot:Gb_39077 [translate_table: standard]